MSPLAGLLLAFTLAGCTGSASTPSLPPLVTVAPTASATAAPTPTPTPTPTLAPTPTPKPGFAATGSMRTKRMSHVAVLLGNGKVLIAGGYGDTAALASAELYDPATGTFTATGSMTRARAHPTATLLGNGKVLIAGGWVSGALNSAELYDPASGTFSATGSMTAARSDHTATLLANGRVLLVGGWAGTSGLASAELYDPATGTFSATGSLATGRESHTATLLNDGRVLVAGGLNSACGTYRDCASAELYDPATGAFSATGSMAHSRGNHTASLLPDGRVLVAGGNHYIASIEQAELYDPATGSFSGSDTMYRHGRHMHTATTLLDGRIALIGGTEVSSSAGGQPGSTIVEIFYSPVDGFKNGASIAKPRVFHTATRLPDGRILVAGGANGESIYQSAEVGWP